MTQLSRCQFLLGTFVSIDIEADAAEHELVAASVLAFEAIKYVQQHFSFHDAQSELSKLNSRAHIKPVVVSAMLWDLLSWCLDLSVSSGGMFDVSVAPLLLKDGRLPNHWSAEEDRVVDYRCVQLEDGQVYFKQAMALDFGGVAKGMAVDLAMLQLESAFSGQLKQAVVNAGGDLRVCDWQAYQLGIVNHEQQIIPHTMRQVALASSAGYYDKGKSEIYHPQIQEAQYMKHTVSVFAPDCRTADALTKVAVLQPDHSVIKSYGAEVMVT